VCLSSSVLPTLTESLSLSCQSSIGVLIFVVTVNDVSLLLLNVTSEYLSLRLSELNSVA